MEPGLIFILSAISWRVNIPLWASRTTIMT